MLNRVEQLYWKIHRFFDNTFYNIKWFFQRLLRGHADIDMWGLNHCLAKFILPRLKAFKALDRMGYPSSMYEEYEEQFKELTKEEEEMYVKKWEEILDKMIFSFEHEEDDCDSWEDEIYGDYMKRAYPDGMFNWSSKKRKLLSKELQDEHKEIMKKLEAVNVKIDEGLVLFGKYFKNLWD